MVEVPAKRWRTGFVAEDFVARVLEGTPRSRPLKSEDFEEEDLLRRSDDLDDNPVEYPAATTSVDLAPIADVLVSELKKRGTAGLGKIGYFSVGREHDDENLFTVVRFTFRRSVQPDFAT